ncbi:MAG: hypothetical protein Aurels2KO_00530 [Aureliella sp.]
MRNGHEELVETNLPIAALDHEMEPPELLARQIELETLSEELERLPKHLRTVVVEHHLLGRSAPAIAHELDVALTTVEGRLRRGRQVLRRHLASRGISMSTLIASSRFMQRSVANCDATQWTHAFIQGGLDLQGRASEDPRDEGRQKLDRSDLIEISSQLVKDFSMLSTTSWKLVSGITIACGVGITAACFAASGTGGQTPQKAANAKMTLQSQPATKPQAQMQLPAKSTPLNRGAIAWQRPKDDVVPR